MSDLIVSTLTQGLIYALLSYGVYITYSVLDFPDLTVDSSFPLGAAVTAILLLGGVDPWLTLLCAAGAGALAGLCTGLIHVRLGVRDLLAGIITMTALSSVNLLIAGSNVTVERAVDTIFTSAPVMALLGDLTLSARKLIVALVLAVVFIRRWKVLDKQYLIGGTVMGFCLFLAYTFQTFGLEQTTSGKNAFFTAVYCVIVPFLYWFIAKRRPDRFNLIAAFLQISWELTTEYTDTYVADVLTLDPNLSDAEKTNQAPPRPVQPDCRLPVHRGDRPGVHHRGQRLRLQHGRCAHPHRRLLLRRPHRGRVQVLRGTGHLHPHHPPVCLLRPLFLAGGTDHPPGADARRI